MRSLIVGDMHVQISNLEESQRLIDFVCSKSLENKVQTIIFLGDQFHNHSVLRLEVIDFWRKAALQLAKSAFEVVFLVGNHDICGDKQKERLMSGNDILEGISGLTICNRPMKISGIDFVPFTSDKEQFVKECLELNNGEIGKTVICHQTFNGAQYENGFFAPDGIEPSVVPQSLIISGHVHSSSKFSKVFYVGSPRWMSMNDANSKKHIALVDFDNGQAKKVDLISTEEVCTPILSFTIKEGEDLPRLKESDRNYVELVGSTAWISKTKKKLPFNTNFKVSPTDRVVSKTERKKGLSLTEFLDTFSLGCGIDKAEVLTAFKECGLV
jgi:DNA repair exonuclease SbcCD nuclease subunit